MKQNLICLSIFVILICNEIYARSFNELKDSVAKELFIKTETIVMQKRAKIENEKFLDPIGRNEMFFKTLNDQSPALLNNTNEFKFGLLQLLKDKTIKKDDYTDFDIVNILYNLCIDHYTEISDSVFHLVKKGLLKFEILENLIIQDFNLTNSVAKNYNNPKLQKLLKLINEDIESGHIQIPSDREGFKEELNRLISGKAWKNDMQYVKIKHPPLPMHEDCR